MIALGSGRATSGHGGDIRLVVGTGDSGDGGDVVVSAGRQLERLKKGAALLLPPGWGRAITLLMGEMVGMSMFTGHCYGKSILKDRGGNITLTGGYSLSSTGGSFVFQTGYGFAASSGSISVSTRNAGKRGVSGIMKVFTGSASRGNSGSFALNTGDATYGKGGFIDLKVGTGDSSLGGSISMAAGKTTARFSGGKISLLTGYSSPTSSGLFQLNTANAGDEGVSGAIHFRTGTTSLGNSGMGAFNWRCH